MVNEKEVTAWCDGLMKVARKDDEQAVCGGIISLRQQTDKEREQWYTEIEEWSTHRAVMEGKKWELLFRKSCLSVSGEDRDS